MASYKVVRRPKIQQVEWDYLTDLYRRNLSLYEIRREMERKFGRVFSAKTISICYRQGYSTPSWAQIPIKDVLEEEQRVARGMLREEKTSEISAYRKAGLLDAAEQLKIEAQGVRGSFAAAITMLGNVSNLRDATLAASKAVGEKIAADVRNNRMAPADAIELIRKMGQATKASVDAFHTSMKALRLHLGAPETILGLNIIGAAEIDGAKIQKELGSEVLRKAVVDLLEGRTTDEVIALIEWQDSHEEAIDVEARTIQ